MKCPVVVANEMSGGGEGNRDLRWRSKEHRVTPSLLLGQVRLCYREQRAVSGVQQAIQDIRQACLEFRDILLLKCHPYAKIVSVVFTLSRPENPNE
jgi:hypothetical protein